MPQDPVASAAPAVAAPRIASPVHGAVDPGELAALGLEPAQVTVFSASVNPYGPPPGILQAVRRAVTEQNLARYPDPECQELRQALARHHGLDPDWVWVGNGSAALIWLLARALGAGRRAAVLAPTFSEYANGLLAAGATLLPVSLPGWRVTSAGHFAPGPEHLAPVQEALAQADPALVFLCNPNNPTGRLLAPQEVRALHRAAPNALWILDEAFMPFVAHPWSAAEWLPQGGWAVLRSLTKDFGLSGLRLGYLLAPPPLIQAIRAFQPPWTVNRLAQVAGLAGLQELAWRQASLARLREDGRAFQAALREHSFHPWPTDANFFLLPVDDPAQARQALLGRRLLVRDATSFGLPGFLRLCVRRPAENQRLVRALSQLPITPQS